MDIQATLKNTIAKAEKLSGQKISKNSNNQYWVLHNGYTISFQCNGRLTEDAEATCFYVTKKARTDDDYNSDYFPGTFWDNITQCFRSANRVRQ